MSTTQLPPVDRRDQIASPPPPAPAARPPRSGRDFLAALLIAFGILLLLANYLTIGGGLVLLALGLAFAFARVSSGRYGLAVPSGLLLGLGAFVSLQEAGRLVGNEAGWSLLSLAVGFVAAYLIGGRPAEIWPFFPAVVLGVLGVFQLGSVSLAPLAPFYWTVVYWPLVLVVLGLWLFVRDRLPAAYRRPIGALITLLLLGYAVIAIGASLAIASPPLGPGFGALGETSPFAPPFQESATLSTPIGATGLLRVNNPTGGDTIIRTSTSPSVQASVTERSWWQATPGQPARLALTNGTLTLDPVLGSGLGPQPRLDFVVDVPATASLDVNASSGRVDIRGTSGSVRVNASSGNVYLGQLSGPVSVQASSGDLVLAETTGDLQARTSSGSIRGTGLTHVRAVNSSSGSVDLSGDFTDVATVQTSSGDVTVRFSPNSSVRVQATTSSGNLQARGLDLAGQSQDQHVLSGTIGAGAGSLHIATSSGNVTLLPAP